MRFRSGAAVTVAKAPTAAPIQPLAQELPYALGVCGKRKKEKKKRNAVNWGGSRREDHE